MIDNAEQILGIEFAAAAQAQDFKADIAPRAVGTDVLYRHIRANMPTYADDRPLGWDLEKARDLLLQSPPPHI